MYTQILKYFFLSAFISVISGCGAPYTMEEVNVQNGMVVGIEQVDVNGNGQVTGVAEDGVVDNGYLNADEENGIDLGQNAIGNVPDGP